VYKSNRGSVKLLDGVYYDQDYNDVYVPLTQSDAQLFVSAVNRQEAELGRRLSLSEIILLVPKD
jgi:hypothetical protein